MAHRVDSRPPASPFRFIPYQTWVGWASVSKKFLYYKETVVRDYYRRIDPPLADISRFLATQGLGRDFDENTMNNFARLLLTHIQGREFPEDVEIIPDVELSEAGDSPGC